MSGARIAEGTFATIELIEENDQKMVLKRQTRSKETELMFEKEKAFYEIIDEIGEIDFIPRYYGFQKSETELILKIEFIEGVNLHQFLLREIPSMEMKIDICLQCCRIMFFLRHSNIVHRDLKAENFMIDRNQRIFLIDFGMTTLVDSKNDSREFGILLGTPAILAPEVHRIKVKSVFKTEIWSLGILFLEIFRGARNLSILSSKYELNLQDKDFEIGYTFQEIAISRLLQKMICVDPNERPSINSILLAFEILS